MLPSISPFQGFGSVGSSGPKRGPSESAAAPVVAILMLNYTKHACNKFPTTGIDIYHIVSSGDNNTKKITFVSKEFAASTCKALIFFLQKNSFINLMT